MSYRNLSFAKLINRSPPHPTSKALDAESSKAPAKNIKDSSTLKQAALSFFREQNQVLQEGQAVTANGGAVGTNPVIPATVAPVPPSVVTVRRSLSLDIWEHRDVNKPHAGSWKCKFCEKTYRAPNPSKIMYHLAGIPGMHIGLCLAIPVPIRAEFKQIYETKQAKNGRGKRGHQEVTYLIEEETETSAFTLERQRTKSSKTAHARNGELVEEGQMLMTHYGVSDTSVLTSAIAKLIYEAGLPFSLTQNDLFKNVLRAARQAPSTYEPPRAQEISGRLLTMQYQDITDKMITKLKTGAETFGLAAYGDGATVRKMALINIMVGGHNNPAACLDIVDCSAHLAIGGKKNGSYIASLFEPHMEKLDRKKKFFDLIMFDGASNVQLAGQILQVQYKQATVMHGVEHVCSLFFDSISKLEPVKDLIVAYRQIYAMFGSGSQHSPYAIFQSHAQASNNDRKIGLIRAAETRMAGYFIAFHRLLRLRGALEATVKSVAFTNLHLTPVQSHVAALLNDTIFYEKIFLLMGYVLPVLRILRLADSNRASMDKLLYFVNCTDRAMRNVELIKLLENITKTPLLSGKDRVAFKIEEYKDLSDDEEKGPVTDLFGSDHEDSINGEVNTNNDSDTEKEDDDEDPIETLDQLVSKNDGPIFRDYQFCDLIVTQWKRRRPQLCNPMIVISWMLSVVPSVRHDVAKNTLGLHQLIAEQWLDRFYCQLPSKERAENKATFWSEYAQFQKKEGPSYGRISIWTCDEVRNGDSHKWHYLYSLKHTLVLGRVACRVTSKTLGIGAAERSWGDVKQLKTGKRSHLSADKIKKQATLFGAACMQKARTMREAIGEVNKFNEWGDGDLNLDLGLDGYGLFDDNADEISVPLRYFHNYIEDWEKDLYEKKTTGAEAKLLSKYRGLKFFDVMSKVLCYFDKEELNWCKAPDRGWCIRSYPCDADKNPDYEVNWKLGECGIFDCIDDNEEMGTLEDHLVVVKQSGDV